MLAEPVATFGAVVLTWRALISALVIIVFAILAAWAVRRLIVRAQRRIGEDRAPALYIVGQILRYAIIFGGLAAAVSTLGVDLSTLSLFAGALGVGIGLGLQDVVKNFVCGLILLFDRSVEIGDYVELADGTSGAVTSVGPRATTLVTNDRVDVLVPNADLLNGTLINWTRNRVTRRIHVPFSVAYGTDKVRVREAAIEAARAVPFTLPETETEKTQVWLTGFGDSALDFELVVWPSLEAVKRPGSMMAAYCWALDDALARHGIEIPFPQRDVRLRGFFGTEGEQAAAMFRGEDFADDDVPATQASGSPAPSVNDAAADVDVAGSDVK